jgi:hypothetical protein
MLLVWIANSGIAAIAIAGGSDRSLTFRRSQTAKSVTAIALLHRGARLSRPPAIVVPNRPLKFLATGEK